MREWAHFRLGWPSRFEVVGQMPAEVGMALEYLLERDVVAESRLEVLGVVEETNAEVWGGLLRRG